MISTWLIIIIIAYFFFSLSNLGDKLVLSGPPKPISYTFYVGLMNAPTLLLIPFIDISLPGGLFIWVIADAVAFVLGMYFVYKAVEKFEVTKVMTVVGSIQPIFIFILSWIFLGQQKLLFLQILSFILLLIGSFLISLEKNLKMSFDYAKFTLAAGLMFSIDYVFSKIVYLAVPFLTGFFWMKILIFVLVLPLLLVKKYRKDILGKNNVVTKETGPFFLFAQFSGGTANILQSFAVSIVPAVMIPIASSLRGVQYTFLFFITLFLSVFFPKILKEEISVSIIVRKLFAIVLIGAGLLILVL